MEKILRIFKKKRNLTIGITIVGVLVLGLLVYQFIFHGFAEILGQQVANTATLFYDENGQAKSANSNTALTVISTPSPSPSPSPSLSPSFPVSPSPSTGTADTTPPVVTVTSPAAGSIVSGSNTKINVTATDNKGVIKIQIYLDGTIVKTGTVATLSYSWNVKKARTGVHTIYAKAYDAAGNVGTSPTITVTK